MIFESHAHYSHDNFDNEFNAWISGENGFVFERFARDGLIERIRQNEIVGIIEPSIGFEAIPAQIELAKKYHGFIFTAIGIHPTRCYKTKWRNRLFLKDYLIESCAIAVGEAGLDFHHKRSGQHRFTQKRWFKYQIRLADKMKLPLVLHIRKADHTALKILNRYRKAIHGGVVHCFNGDLETAKNYISLGFAIGIGGAILNDNDSAYRLRRVIKEVPLTSILLETDAPFVSPDSAGADLSRKQRAKTNNSSLILPAVAERIAKIKECSVEEVENTTTQNVLRIFGVC